MQDSPEKFSANEQTQGYLYQPRLALYQILELDERTGILIEKQDDLEFIDENGELSLHSLKHKDPDDKVTDLATDFWKSVRVWLVSYSRHKATKDLRFFMFTTATAKGEFSKLFLPGAKLPVDDEETLAEKAAKKIAQSKAKLIKEVQEKLNELSKKEQEDFFSRITIFDCMPRISDLPELIKKQHLKTVKREARNAVFERLEGWWNEEIVRLLTGMRTEPILGAEVSDKLCQIADEYKSDNLPITFGGTEPQNIDVSGDPRIFVAQLRELGISGERVRFAIIDYYRAFEQRSAWARESLLVTGEIEKYEARLTEEWGRYKAVIFDGLTDKSPEATLRERGDALYKWAQMECLNIKIRSRVDEAYVVRGNFQILANENPPRVYWHPQFLQRLVNILGASQ